MRSTPGLAFNALVKFEDGLWVAHCLELDIVATGDSPEAAIDDIKSLILAQVSCALSNENMDYLYHPAPAEVWQEYRTAKAFTAKNREEKPALGSFFKTIVADAFQGNACHA